MPDYRVIFVKRFEEVFKRNPPCYAIIHLLEHVKNMIGIDSRTTPVPMIKKLKNSVAKSFP